MILRPRCWLSVPSTASARPGSMPAMRVRPSQMTVIRSALERVQRPLALFRGRRRLLAEFLQRLVGKPDLQQVTGRDRVIAADHDDGCEYLLQGPGLVFMSGRRAADEAAQEPAGPVHP